MATFAECPACWIGLALGCAAPWLGSCTGKLCAPCHSGESARRLPNRRGSAISFMSMFGSMLSGAVAGISAIIAGSQPCGAAAGACTALAVSGVAFRQET
eukprot:TRINITY_DN72276_c0_g1_i1.p1 TRINITY_DN72276_c0_g1~~TRINITY_DN72276_c0_g1_i1.p1  ORF type:complete len:100 (-),score=2.84 TRINITY_DN72276_c0_g1_i1:112-411(-)